jgi:hypothetical protein
MDLARVRHGGFLICMSCLRIPNSICTIALWQGNWSVHDFRPRLAQSSQCRKSQKCPPWFHGYDDMHLALIQSLSARCKSPSLPRSQAEGVVSAAFKKFEYLQNNLCFTKSQNIETILIVLLSNFKGPPDHGCQFQNGC